MPTRTQILALVVAALLGAVAGAFFGNRSNTPEEEPAPEARPSTRLLDRPPPPAAPPATAREAVRAEAPAAQTVRALEAELAAVGREKEQLQKQLSDFLNWLLVNYKGRYPLPESYMAKLRLIPVTEEFSLHPEVAELLQITPAEEQVINEAFLATKEFLGQMETALMTINEDQQDKVVVHVPAFGDEGELVREDLLLALEATLGPDRFDRFMDVAQEEMEKSFLKFGEMARTIIFEVFYPEGEEMPLLTIKDGFVEEVEGKRLITATQMTVPELPEEYLAYIDWITQDEGTRAK